jgi:uncharacterized damage-inducible protein DinB
MFTPAAVRDFLFDQLRKDLSVVRHILSASSPEDLTTYRDGGTGWTALEVLCHLRDFEAINHERARLILEQDFPDFPVTDPDAMAAEGQYSKQDLSAAYDEWAGRRARLLADLQAISDEAVWTRQGRHFRRGDMTLQDLLVMVAWHDVNHMEQITRILTEQQPG